MAYASSRSVTCTAPALRRSRSSEPCSGVSCRTTSPQKCSSQTLVMATPAFSFRLVAVTFSTTFDDAEWLGTNENFTRRSNSSDVTMGWRKRMFFSSTRHGSQKRARPRYTMSRKVTPGMMRAPCTR
ncbi:hypothetical protein COSO111634_05305 [Corallococcus soli]